MMINTWQRSKSVYEALGNDLPRDGADWSFWTARRSTAELRMRVLGAFNNLSGDCVDLLKSIKPFGSLSDESLLARSISRIGQTSFIDAGGAGGELQLRYAEVGGVVPTGAPQEMTVKEYASWVILNDLAEGGLSTAVTTGSAVVLFAPFYAASGAIQDRTLIHEMLHVGSGAGDIELARMLRIKGLGANISAIDASREIDRFLAGNCSNVQKP